MWPFVRVRSEEGSDVRRCGLTRHVDWSTVTLQISQRRENALVTRIPAIGVLSDFGTSGADVNVVFVNVPCLSAFFAVFFYPWRDQRHAREHRQADYLEYSHTEVTLHAGLDSPKTRYIDYLSVITFLSFCGKIGVWSSQEFNQEVQDRRIPKWAGTSQFLGGLELQDGLDEVALSAAVEVHLADSLNVRNQRRSCAWRLAKLRLETWDAYAITICGTDDWNFTRSCLNVDSNPTSFSPYPKCTISIGPETDEWCIQHRYTTRSCWVLFRMFSLDFHVQPMVHLYKEESKCTFSHGESPLVIGDRGIVPAHHVP